EVLISGLSALIIIGLFFWLAVDVFEALLNFYLVAIAGLLLAPFMVFEKTAFVGERVFGTLVAHGVRLSLLALIISAALPILVAFKLPNDPTLQQIFLLGL